MAQSEAAWVHACVVVALPHETQMVAVRVPAGSTLQDAVTASQLLTVKGESAQVLDVGVFGLRLPAATPLNEGDRVEIYRALTIDPKEARRLRAAVRRAQSAKSKMTE